MADIEIQFKGTVDDVWKYVIRFFSSYIWPKSITHSLTPQKYGGDITILIHTVTEMTDAERNIHGIPPKNPFTFDEAYNSGPVVGRLEIIKVTDMQSALKYQYKVDEVKTLFNSLDQKIISDGLKPGIIQHQPPPAKPSGRPSNKDDDWAYEQLYSYNRPTSDVYREWFQRIGTRAEELVDPEESFRKAMQRRKRKKGNKV